MRAPGGQLAVAAGVFAFGAFVTWGSFHLPTGGGYAQVGPGVVPRIVGIGLLALGAWLLLEAASGGFRGLDEEAEARLPMHWAAFGWVSASLIAYGALIERLGFILSSVLLFLLVARAFGSRRWLRDAAWGALLAAAIYAIFTRGLGVTLPPGVLEGVF